MTECLSGDGFNFNVHFHSRKESRCLQPFQIEHARNACGAHWNTRRICRLAIYARSDEQNNANWPLWSHENGCHWMKEGVLTSIIHLTTLEGMSNYINQVRILA